MSDITDREREILDLVKAGSNSPSELAEKLGISQSGASQALQKLAGKGKLVRRKAGRGVHYESPRQNRDNELSYLFQSYNSLSQVWAYIMSMELPQEKLRKARKARDTLERILSRKQ